MLCARRRGTGSAENGLTMSRELVAGLLVAVCFIAWRMLRPYAEVVRLSVGVLLFAGLTVSVARLVESPLQPVFGATRVEELLFQQSVVAVWWLLAAKLLVEAMRFAVLRGGLAQEGRLFSDLVAGLIYLVALLSIVGTVFGLPIRALVATSGVIAIVLGLALQNTLSDVFSGLAVGIERPYAIGDRIWIEGPVEGVVVQINWRSVRIRTDSDDIATVPNSLAAKSRVVNRSVPTTRRSDVVHVPCAASVPPERVFELVRNGILLCSAVLPQPAPSVSLVKAGARFNRYAIAFSVGSSDGLGRTKSQLLTEVLRQFRSVGIGADPHPPQAAVPDDDDVDRIRAIGIPLFHALTRAQSGALRAKLQRRTVAPGEALFVEGDTDRALFIVGAGVLEVSRKALPAGSVVGRVGPGDYIGEIALLTGVPHAATVTALTPAVTFQLQKEDLAPLLTEAPDLMRALEASARHGQELLDRAVAASVGVGVVPSGPLLSLIRDYFWPHMRHDAPP